VTSGIIIDYPRLVICATARRPI